MKYSVVFPKTLKQAPSGVASINHQLLVRAGFIHQEMAGVYTYLPLGWRVLDKISDIVREEMDNIGGQEFLMPALHPASNWEKTGRYTSFDALYKVEGSAGVVSEGTKMILAPTHEEIIYPLLSEYIKSYKDLPLYLYQIQMKFRNEPRAKAGLLRGREFLMKDLYSFHTNDDDRNEYYGKVRDAYFKIFKRIGIQVVKTKASGGTFSDISEEFQTITPSGEDTVFICSKEAIAFNKGIIEGTKCPECGSDLREEKAIEVGNIFPLKRAYAEVFNLNFTDKDGEKKIVSAGCYGLGISRVMGAIVEVFNDGNRGIRWPESVAPYQVHLVGFQIEDSSVKDKVEEVYKLLLAKNVDVLFDDRADASAGAKFADADLIGIPYRVVVSKKTSDKLEVKKRSEQETKFLSIEDLIKFVNQSSD